jgi:hypothetical protein
MQRCGIDRIADCKNPVLTPGDCIYEIDAWDQRFGWGEYDYVFVTGHWPLEQLDDRLDPPHRHYTMEGPNLLGRPITAPYVRADIKFSQIDSVAAIRNELYRGRKHGDSLHVNGRRAEELIGIREADGNHGWRHG